MLRSLMDAVRETLFDLGTTSARSALKVPDALSPEIDRLSGNSANNRHHFLEVNKASIIQWNARGPKARVFERVVA